jgi:hypothetical protein
MVMRRAACVAAFGAVLTGIRGLADDLTTKDGKVYKDEKVVKTDNNGVTIEYTETITIPFDSLPDDVQKKYGHDPNALSAEQAAEKARIEAENRESAKVEAVLAEQDRQIEPDLARIKARAGANYAAAPMVRITGQIFVAPQGGQAVDFSGIHVQIVPMELISRWLPEKESHVAAETRLLKPRIDRAQKDEDQALKERFAAVGTDKFRAALDKESQARDILAALTERQDYFIGGQYFADTLTPWSVAETITDLNGKFSIMVPSAEDFILSAGVKAESGTTITKYFWFVKIHPAANINILLDSENQSSSGSEDSILKTEVTSKESP